VKRSPTVEHLSFLVFSIDGGDGICRAVVSLANKLVEDHHVEIISFRRRRREPVFMIDERVTVSYLEDARPIGRRGRPIDGRVRAGEVPHHRGRIRAFLDRRQSRLAPKEAAPDISLLSDLLLRRKLRSLSPGVLISTRPSFHAAAARYAPPHVITVAQEHMSLASRQSQPATMRVVHDSVRRMDALVTLTDGDRDDYETALTEAETIVEAIPNAVPWTVNGVSAAESRRKVVVSAGRLEKVKGFPRLIRAYEPIVDTHPDWQLHIYGRGRESDELERLIAERDLGDHVILKGHTDRFEDVLSEVAVCACASHNEGFGMVLLEAMSKGVPVVSFDVPRGPAKLVADGESGRLVSNGDQAAYTKALLELIENDDVRARMGTAAFEAAQAYEIDAVAGRWDALVDRLLRQRSG
jgi:glycosyltransferase involved in cell wall biosynthesis